MEGNAAAAHTQFLLFLLELLANFHLQVDVEFLTSGQFFLHILSIDNVIHRRAEAGAEEAIGHFLADDDVIAAALGKEIHPCCNFTVAQQGRSRHGVVPIAIDPLEGEYRGECGGIHSFHRDTAAECVRQPDE